MKVVRDREAGNIIEQVESIEAGKNLIKEFEAQDKEDGTYTEDFYEVADVPGYYLDFDTIDQDAFTLNTVDHDEVYAGRLSDIVKDGDEWQDALDRFFEKELGIAPADWVIG